MKNRHINALGLFDGMSCMQIALKELGYPVDTYYASEIDKHAIAQTQYNFPDTIQLGDVTKWREWDIEWSAIDLIGAGSPCQGFSFAGKQLAFNDPRSVLFFVFVDILNHIKQVNPNVQFLLENVRMKAEHEAVITQYTGVGPLYINSALVSAQNRERLYWTNIGMVQRGLFGEWYPGIPQPEDRGILLRDILESEVDEKCYLNNKALERIDRKIGFVPQVNPEKTGTLNTCNNSSRLSFDNGTTLVGVLNDRGQIRETKQSTCIDANYWKGMDNHAQRTMIVAMRGRNPENPSDRTAGCPTEQRLEPNLSGKTNTLTSAQKDNLVCIGNIYPSGGENGNIYSTNGKSPKIKSGETSNSQAVEYNTRIRRLTPLECSRLQTIPTWYRWNCSDTQIYRMLGNGWTVEVIKHILKYL